MFHSKINKRLPATILAAGLSLLLTGCFITPGKFDSHLDLRSDGNFTYSYKGEIRMIGLAQLARMENSSSYESEWAAEYQVCWGDEDGAADAVADAAADVAEAVAEAATDQAEKEVTIANGGAAEAAAWDEAYGERPCTEAELAEKRQEFEQSQIDRKERKEREAQQMQAIFGGIDPSDPEAGAKLAARLENQNGWNKVEYRGDGLFVVDVAISSRIDHGFSFPMMQGMTTATPFIYFYRLKDNTVRIDAPGFSRGAGQSGGGSPAWLLAAKGFDGGNSRDQEMMALFEGMSGTFTITTDGEILANNTEQGYKKAENGRKLTWVIDSLTNNAPTALIKLGG